MEGIRSVILTWSWDDGHPADLRVAEIMSRYGLRGTFYVPMQNREGRPVLSTAGLRELASHHEIGSHTYSHCYLNRVGLSEADREVRMGKEALECLLGRSITGFCYPGGKYRTEHVALVRQAGFVYARGSENCHADLAFDRLKMPTTMQLYPHARHVYLRNFLTQGQYAKRMLLAQTLLKAGGLLGRLIDCVDRVRQTRKSAAIHFWGHSWELDQIDGWSVLERFCHYLSDQPDLIKVANGALAEMSCDNRPH